MSAIHERIARIARQVLSERFASTEDQADAMAAAIMTGLREDGVAVVELPKPDDPSTYSYGGCTAAWFIAETSDGDPIDVAVFEDRIEVAIPNDDRFDPKYARLLAAALLAAAERAETAPDPHAGELWANELERRARQVPSDREFS